MSTIIDTSNFNVDLLKQYINKSDILRVISITYMFLYKNGTVESITLKNTEFIKMEIENALLAVPLNCYAVFAIYTEVDNSTFYLFTKYPKIYANLNLAYHYVYKSFYYYIANSKILDLNKFIVLKERKIKCNNQLLIS